MNWKDILKIVVSFIITGLLTSAVMFLNGIYKNTSEIPKLKEQLTDQERINVDLNTRLYNIEKWKMSDSIRKQIYRELKTKKK